MPDGAGADVTYHLLRFDGTAPSDVPLTGIPADAQPQSVVATAETAAPGRLLLEYAVPDPVIQQTLRLSAVDPVSGAVRFSVPFATGLGVHVPVLRNTETFGYLYLGTAHLFPLADPTAPERLLGLPHPSTVTYQGALTDDALVGVRKDAAWNNGQQDPLYSVPLSGGTGSPTLPDATTLLPDASGVAPTADGGFRAEGGADADHWDTYRFGPDGGEPADLHRNVPNRPVRYGMSYARGRLTFLEGVDGAAGFTHALYVEDLGPGAVPQPTLPPVKTCWTVDPVNRCAPTARCAELAPVDGSARITYLTTAADGRDYLTDLDPYTADDVELDSAGGRIVDAANGYVIYDSGSSGLQYVLHPGYDGPAPATPRPISGAGLWDNRLWTAASTTGEIDGKALTGGSPTLSVMTGAPCVPQDVQADVSLLYWSCGPDGPAGVFDTGTRKQVPVPAGPALLGDGFLVRHPGGELQVTDARTGATGTVAALPADPALPDTGRGVSWTVDKYRGQIAYTTADAVTHLISSGVAPSRLTVSTSYAGTGFSVRDSGQWQGGWQLSGPGAALGVTFRDTDGRVVRTVADGPRPTAYSAYWDGRDAAGHYVTDGTYTWTAVVTPADGSDPVTLTGSIRVSGSAPVRRDFGSQGGGQDNTGDLLTLGSNGGLSIHYGTGGGTFAGSSGYIGWNLSTLFVPVGDSDNNGCNDLFVRLPSGEARIYHAGSWPSCTGFPPASADFTRLGTGWQSFDAVTSPGDLTGDGFPDVLAHDAATGELWLHPGNGTGGAGPRTLLAAGWPAYRQLVGAGDLNRDGHPDLLALDSANTLWRYDGTAAGTLAPRVRLLTNWANGAYDLVVGVGDITGDGVPDVVERDTDGNLWRNNGDGAGALGARARIATGYGGYVAVV
ncbi:FG-GAP-like repeat-containing protein [Actinacidiphila sp. ITFR-21]|uniref:FG-GAP-like repeat-containing protein n=1 Tax=Actinacidiphila sp. ITFR-21 TaxID=3075199 RepID=UPI00288B3C0A|nr:FG-GAP-like repeat-containing protein [Streptomyces sp. ITFR-21]WNI17344.1 FG-GAP-like repeat-containing protein [Streptomyces sp. ITFR-21]